VSSAKNHAADNVLSGYLASGKTKFIETIPIKYKKYKKRANERNF